MARKIRLPKELQEQVDSTDRKEWSKTHNFTKYGKNRKQLRKEQRQEKKQRRSGQPARLQDAETQLEPNQNGKTQGQNGRLKFNSNPKTAAETMAALKMAKLAQNNQHKSGSLGNETAEKKPGKSQSQTESLEDKKRGRPRDLSGSSTKKLKLGPSAHEVEMMAKEEEDAKYYAKKLGLKSLKIKGEDDGFGDLLGGLDFDHFYDRSQDELDNEDARWSDSDSLSLANAEQTPHTKVTAEGSKAGIDTPEDSDVVANPWSSDDSLSEGDFTDNTDLEGGVNSPHEKPLSGAEEELDDKMTVEESMAALRSAKSKPGAKATKSEPSFQTQNTDSDIKGDSAELQSTVNSLSGDDSVSEGDLTDDTDTEDEEPHVNGHSGEDSGIFENPWGDDDSLSDGDFTDNSDLEGDVVRGNDSQSDSDEELDDNMTVDETMAALKALKSKNKTPPSKEVKVKEPKEPKEKESPYLPPGPSKYTPPARRRLLGNSGLESEEEQRLKRLVKSSLNKLAESNIGSIVNELEKLFVENSRNLVGQVLTNVIIESVAQQNTLQEVYLATHAALITALFKTIGINFGAQFIQLVVAQFEKNYQDEDQGKSCYNILYLILECYMMQMVSCKLIYDFIRQFLSSITEQNTELLLLIIRTCGSQLRSDDPEALKNIIVLLQSTMARQDKDQLSMRTKFLVESIMALKNNRQKPASEGLHTVRLRLRKFLGGIHGQATEPLQVTLDDIKNIETKGKWWLVGAAWNNGGSSSKVEAQNTDHEDVANMLDTAEPNWLDLAKKQRLNTDVRRAVFVALMGSEDYMDAVQRIDKLHLKSKQEREVPFVILHCCSNEECYNPFYALVASKECTRHSVRKTFQFSLWDFLAQLAESSTGNESLVRKAMHYGRFYSFLVAQGALSLEILKTIDLLTASGNVAVFLDVFFIHLFRTIGKEAETQGARDNMGNETRQAQFLAKTLTSVKDQPLLRGMQYYFPRILHSEALGTSKKAVARVKWAVQLSTDMISELVSRAHISAHSG